MDGDLYFKQTHDVRTQGLSLFYLNIYAHDSPVLYTVTRFCQKSFETAQKLEMKLFNEEWEKNKKKTFFEARSICNCAVFQVCCQNFMGLFLLKRSLSSQYRIRSDEGLTLETSAFESLYSGQLHYQLSW